MKYYNTIEELNNDITKNKLMFSSSLAKNSYKKSIGVSTSFGNVTNLNSKNIPVVIINLSPTFNISANKINTSEKILNKIIKSADILPYVTYIYKNNIDRKNTILDSEYSYDVRYLDILQKAGFEELNTSREPNNAMAFKGNEIALIARRL